MTESKPLIVAGADGFGEDLENVLVEHCRAQGYEVDDLGTGAYYDKAGEVARRVQTDGAKGLLFCGTGMGVGIRGQQVQRHTSRDLRERGRGPLRAQAINNSNVLCLGGKVTTPEDAAPSATPGSVQGNRRLLGERHHRRDVLTASAR